MTQQRRNLALVIKSCLESLEREASAGALSDLAHFISLAVMAADDAAASNDANAPILKAITSTTAGHC